MHWDLDMFRLNSDAGFAPTAGTPIPGIQLSKALKTHPPIRLSTQRELQEEVI